MSDPDWNDPLYRPLDALPEGATLLRLGDVECGVTVTDTDPDSLAAQWMADRVVSLSVTDDVTAKALRDVLPAFLAHARELVDRPTRASITLPARDVDRGRVAQAAGLAVGPVVAVADLRRGWFRSRPDVEIADATSDDAGEVTALVLEQARYEQRLGAFRLSPAIEVAIGRGVEEVIAGPETVLLARRDGRAVGLVESQPPATAKWITGRCAREPAAYLSVASTASQARGTRVGTALVAELHHRHRRDGLGASLLHWTPTNPLAVPFWSRCDYRPLLASFATTLRP